MKNRNIIFLLAVLAPLFMAIAIVSFQNYQRLAAESARQEANLRLLAEEKKQLQESIERFASPVGIEMEARARFNMIREGETMVILVPPSPLPSPEPTPEPEPSFWEQVLRMVPFLN